MASPQLELPLPDDWPAAERQAFLASARAVAVAEPGRVNGSGKNGFSSRHPATDAAIHVLQDLADQGWGVQVRESGAVFVAPPDAKNDPQAEKDRVRQQELLKRNEQLATPSVRRFINRMEHPREFRGSFVSVFNLMR